MKIHRRKRTQGHRLGVHARHRWSFTVQETEEARGGADQDGSPSGRLQGSCTGLRIAGGAGACQMQSVLPEGEWVEFLR